MTHALSPGIISAVALPQLPTEEPRAERLGEAEQTIRFRSLLRRDIEDQAEATRRGYTSVEQLAIDELGRAYHDLNERLDTIERRLDEILRG